MGENSEHPGKVFEPNPGCGDQILTLISAISDLLAALASSLDLPPPAHAENFQLLRVHEAANLFGCSTKTVHKLVRQKKLACVQVTSKERRFTPEQVREFIQRQSVSARKSRTAVSPPAPGSRQRDRKLPKAVDRDDLLKEMRSWR